MQDIPANLSASSDVQEAKTDSIEMTTSVTNNFHHKHHHNGCCDQKNGGSHNHNQNSSDKNIRVISERKQNPLDKSAVRRLVLAATMCLIFMVAEIIGGYLAGSLAIATDAAHLLTDLVSFLISLVALTLARRPPSNRLTFGWYRAEVLGALVSVLLIWVVTAVMVYMAVRRIVLNNYDIEGEIMLIVAGIGVLMNIVMGIVLSVGGVPHGHTHGSGAHSHSHGSSGHGHSHSNGSSGHGHSHGNEKLARGSKNINVRAALIHVIGDLLQSIGVFIASLIVYFKPTWKIVDPICTFLFSILVLITTVTILKDTIVVLMEGLPNGDRLASVTNDILGVSGVSSVRKVRMWAITMDREVVMATVVLRPMTDSDMVLKQIGKVLSSRDHIFDFAVQLETHEIENGNLHNSEEIV